MLISSFYPLIGGAEQQALRLSKELTKKGNEVEVITRKYEGLSDQDVVDDVKITRFKVGKIAKLAPIIYLVKVLIYLMVNRKKVDIIHAHALSAAGFTAAIASFFLKIPSIAKIAGGGDESGCEIVRIYNKGLFGRLRVRIMRKNIKFFIAISKDIEKDLIKVGVPNNKIKFIPNGINIKEYNECSNLESNLNFLYMGRLEHVKGIDILIETWTKLLEKYPQTSAKLFICGSGKLSHIIPSHNSIVYQGQITNAKKIYAQMSTLILPSRYEGISNTLLEAMASQKLIIASNKGGNKDLIGNNMNGLLYDSKTELLSILEEVVNSDGQNYFQLRMNARDSLYENFDLSNTTKNIINVYNESLNRY